MQNMVGSRPVYVEKKPKYISVFMFFVMCCLFEVFPSFTPHSCSPTIVKSFQDILFDHKNDIEHILYGYISRKHEFRRRTFSIFLLLFFMIFDFLKYFSFLPLKFPSPRSLNPSKIIFLIIKYIQNIYCMVIRPENISSGNLLFVNFSEPRIEENKALFI